MVGWSSTASALRGCGGIAQKPGREVQAFLEQEDPIGASRCLVPFRVGWYQALASEMPHLATRWQLIWHGAAYYGTWIGLVPPAWDDCW